MSRRILTAVLSVTALAVAAFFVPAALAIRNAQEREQLLTLQREASVVASRIPPDGPIDEAALARIVDSEHRLGLYASDGRLIEGVGPVTADRIVEIALDGNFAEGRVGGDLVAAVPVRALVDGSTLVMRIEAPQSEARDQFVASMLRLAGAAVAIFAVAGAVGFWVARRLNRPVEELRRWASDPAPDPPPPPATGIAELDSLRSDLIADRARIADLLQRERSFSSHVSHQLRTPVSAMRVAVETELTAPRDDPAELLHEALGQLDRLESTITSLLALARHAALPAGRIDLLDLVRRRVTAVDAAAADRGRTLLVEGDAVQVVSDEAAIGHIADVLLENAVRHGAGAITVTISSHDRVAVLDVADEGATPTDVFSDAAADAGHGIGLRLARTLAESIGGELQLLDRPTTTFRLVVPVERGDDPDAAGRPPTFTRR